MPDFDPQPLDAGNAHDAALLGVGGHVDLGNGTISTRTVRVRPAELSTGVRLGSWLVGTKLGQGEFGEEWSAKDADSGTPAVLTVLSNKRAFDRGLVRRLMRELHAAESFSHPVAVPLPRLELQDGYRFLSNSQPIGENVEAMAQRLGRLPVSTVVSIAHQAAAMIANASEVGVTHRWLRPSVMSLDVDGRLRVAGYGLWPLGDWIGELGAEPTGAAWGSRLGYSAPEAMSGDEVRAQADIYSLGVTMLRLLTGQRPEAGGLRTDILKGHSIRRLDVEHPSLDGIQEELHRVISKMCSQDQAGRYVPRLLLSELEAMDREVSAPLAKSGRVVPRRSIQPTNTIAEGHSLPELSAPLIGREVEVAAGIAHLASHDVVTLLGTGGVGKTSLSLAIGRAMLPSLNGGAWFCDLAACRRQDEVAAAVGRGLGMNLPPSNVAKQVGMAIAGRGDVLVILDNCEQATEAVAALIASWKPMAPSAIFLLTSRQQTYAPGEHPYPISPLATPPRESIEVALSRSRRLADDAASRIIPKVIAESPAVKLFVDRAQTTRPGFSLTAANWQAVGAIVRKLDGIPLGVRLAAAHVATLSPHQILERLEGSITALSGSGELAGGRHASLQAAMDWSWGLLAPWEQAAYAQLSVFQGGFTIDAAEAVVDVSAWPSAPWAIDIIHSLWAKSLLTCSYNQFDGVRFGMLETVKEHATDALRGRIPAIEDAPFKAGGPSELAAHQRHWEFFSVHGHPSIPVNQPLTRYRTDHAADSANIVVAFDRAREAGAVPEAMWLGNAVLDVHRSCYRLAEALPLIEAIESVPADCPESNTWRATGIADIRGSAEGPAVQLALAEKALEAAKECSDPRYGAMAHYMAVWGHMYRGNSDGVLQHARAAQAMMGPDRKNDGIRFMMMEAEATALYQSGNFEDAEALFKQAEKIIPEEGSRHYRLMLNNDLAIFNLYRGTFREALRLNNITIASSSSRFHRVGDAGFQKGIILRVIGEIDEAIPVLESNIEFYRKQGSFLRANIIRCQLATARFQKAGFTPEGESHLLNVLEPDAPISRYFSGGGPLFAYAAWSAASRGDVTTAERYLASAEAAEKAAGGKGIAPARHACAWVRLVNGDWKGALESADMGIEIAGGDPDDSLPLRALRHQIRVEAARLGELGLVLENEKRAAEEYLVMIDGIIAKERLTPMSFISKAAQQLRDGLAAEI